MNEQQQQPHIIEEKPYRIGEFISKGWQFTKQHLGFLIGYLAIIFIISLLFSGVAEALSDQGRNLLSYLMHLAGWIVGLFIQMGWYKSGLLITSGIKPGFNQLYANDKHFLSYLLGYLLYGLVALVGLILLIVPGIYFMVKYMLYPFFILDQNMGPIQALEAAGKASKGKWWFLFGLLLVLMLLNIGGALLLGVGLLFTIPISMLALAAVYRRFTNTENEMAVKEVKG